MKKIKSIFPLMLALVLMLSIGVTAFADEPASQDIPDTQVQFIEDDAAANPISGISIEEELPTVIDITPADSVEAEADEPAAADEQQPQKSSNTPYLVGAVLAVALFIGVSVFCKFKGNR